MCKMIYIVVCGAGNESSRPLDYQSPPTDTIPGLRSIILMGQLRPLFYFYFVYFQSNITILQQIYVKNVHPIYGAGF